MAIKHCGFQTDNKNALRSRMSSDPFSWRTNYIQVGVCLLSHKSAAIPLHYPAAYTQADPRSCPVLLAARIENHSGVQVLPGLIFAHFFSVCALPLLLPQVATAAAIDDRPSCFRFPRGNGVGVDLAAEGIKDMKGVPLEVSNGHKGMLLSCMQLPACQLNGGLVVATSIALCSCQCFLYIK